MRNVVPAGERGLRASLSRTSPLTTLSLALALALVLVLVACAAPEGSRSPAGSADADPSIRGAAVTPAPSGGDPGSGDLGRPGGHDLEVVTYSVEEALSAEGGEAIGSMLNSLEVDRDAVDLTLAIGAGGEPAISDWRLPGASADAILDAWEGAGPGNWSSVTLAGLPALSGEGPDGSSAWAIAVDGRFVYVRTDDLAIAEDVARNVGG